MTITLGKAELDDAQKVALHKLSKTVKAPGFRKGKVPASVAAKHVDVNALAEQALDDALSKAVATAFTSEDIRALDRPQVEVKKYIPAQELEFTAEVEILPKVTLGKYNNMGVKKVVGKVADADIDDVVLRMQKGFAVRKDVSRASKNGDEAIIDFTGKRDGVAFDGGSAKDYTLALGSSQFVPGFEEAIVGHKAGDEFDVELTFPKDYHSTILAGQDVVFAVSLKTVKEVALPEVDDALAAKAGPFKTVKELEDDIRRELLAGREREAGEKWRDSLVSKLVELSKVPVPEILLSDQVHSIEQDMTQNLAYQGMTLQNYLDSTKQTHEHWLATEVHEAANRRVQAGLALAEMSKVEKIVASDEELSAKINQYQAQYGKQSGQDLTSPEFQRDIANRLLTEKTVDRLVELNS